MQQERVCASHFGLEVRLLCFRGFPDQIPTDSQVLPRPTSSSVFQSSAPLTTVMEKVALASNPSGSHIPPVKEFVHFLDTLSGEKVEVWTS